MLHNRLFKKFNPDRLRNLLNWIKWFTGIDIFERCLSTARREKLLQYRTFLRICNRVVRKCKLGASIILLLLLLLTIRKDNRESYNDVHRLQTGMLELIKCWDICWGKWLMIPQLINYGQVWPIIARYVRYGEVYQYYQLRSSLTKYATE